MDEREFQRCCAVLGVGPDVTVAELEKAQVRRAFALLKAPENQKAELRAASEALAKELRCREEAQRHVPAPAGGGMPRPPREELLGASSGGDERAALLDPLSFDSWLINLMALPLLLALAWAVNASPLGFLLRGFHVWVHEFGHATVAWLSGYRALPLPIGWTNVEPERASFVYFGVLFLLGVMFWAGWRERKIWPLLLPLVIAPVQFHMTWQMPAHRGELWLAFGGVGGEFYLSTALMALFYVQMPEKFRWGGCRYVFAFLGASSFLNIWLFWRKVARFEELVPYGSLINGEDDAGGDMNILRLHGWRETEIVHTYTTLGLWCLAILAVVWLVFATRLDRVIGDRVTRLLPAAWRGEEG